MSDDKDDVEDIGGNLGGLCACRRCRTHDFFEGTETTNDTETWRSAAQTLAADNARLCAIALAADKLEQAVTSLVQDAHQSLYTNLRAALDAYKIARQGQ